MERKLFPKSYFATKNNSLDYVSEGNVINRWRVFVRLKYDKIYRRNTICFQQMYWHVQIYIFKFVFIIENKCSPTIFI